MISRVTLWLLLVALLIPSGLVLWSMGRQDNCSRLRSGDASQPRSQMVEEGGRMVEVPCSDWLPRQPLWAQLLCLVECVVVLVLGVNLFGDVMDGRRVRRE